MSLTFRIQNQSQTTVPQDRQMVQICCKLSCFWFNLWKDMLHCYAGTASPISVGVDLRLSRRLYFAFVCLSVSRITRKVVNEFWLIFFGGWDVWLATDIDGIWITMQILEFLKAFYHCRIGAIVRILPITQNLLIFWGIFWGMGCHTSNKPYHLGADSDHSPSQRTFY